MNVDGSKPTPEPVAYQAKRADDSPLARWEDCTRDAYEATLRTGRYLGFENGPPGEARALYDRPCPLPAGLRADRLQYLADSLNETAHRIATTQRMDLTEWWKREQTCKEASHFLSVLAQTAAGDANQEGRRDTALSTADPVTPGLHALVAEMQQWVRSVESSGPGAAARTVVVQEWIHKLRSLIPAAGATT